MSVPDVPLFIVKKHTADKAAAVTGAVRIMMVQAHADGAQADIQLCDALTDTSSDELVYSLVDGDTRLFDYTPVGGVQFETGLTVDITGTGAKAIIWTDQLQAAT